jgi:hypothetical protein
MEYKIKGGLLSADFYYPKYDMIIDIHGPSHYTNLTLKPIDSTLYVDRIVKKYHKHYLTIDFTTFNMFLTKGEHESDLKKAGVKLKEHIE